MTKKNECRLIELLLVLWLLGMPVVYGWKVNAWRAEATSQWMREDCAIRAFVFALLWPVMLPFSVADSAFAPKQPVQPERSAQ